MEKFPIQHEKELQEIFSLIETSLNIKIVNWWIPLFEDKDFDNMIEKYSIFIKIDEDLTYERYDFLETEMNTVAKDLLDNSKYFEFVFLL